MEKWIDMTKRKNNVGADRKKSDYLCPHRLKKQLDDPYNDYTTTLLTQEKPPPPGSLYRYDLHYP